MLTPIENLAHEFRAWATTRVGEPFAELVLAFAQTHDLAGYGETNPLAAPNKAFNFYQHDAGIPNTAGALVGNCPLTPSVTDCDVYVVDNTVYPRDSPALCERCVHALACSLENGPGADGEREFERTIQDESTSDQAA